MDWETVKDVFTERYLGDLPEGFVPDCTIADWEKLFGFLRSGGWKYQYLEDVGHYDDERPLPGNPAYPLRDNADGSRSAMLKVWPDPALLVWFWVERETHVDFDVSMYRLEGRAGFGLVCDFLGTLGRLLGKPVFFGYHDDDQEHPAFRFDVETDQVVLQPVVDSA